MLDRRSFVAAAATSAMLGLAGRVFAKNTDCDVVIIGAGVAGLAAARHLQMIGQSFVMLEARNRIGGRAWTQDLMGVPVDRGAHWLHSAEINPLVDFAKSRNLSLTPSTREEGRLFDGPGQLAADTERAIARSDRALERAFRRRSHDLDGTSLDSFAVDDGALAARLIAFAIGEEPGRIAAGDVAAMAEDGTDLAIEGGLGRFVQGIGAGIPVSLGARVERIDWSTSGGVTVSGPFGSLRARACLITVPPAVLSAESGIRFEPELPNAKQAAMERLPMGVFTKVALRLDGPIAELPLYSVDAQRFSRGSLHALHHAPGSALVTLMIGGDGARDLIAAGEQAAIAEAQTVLAAVAGSLATTKVRGGLLSEWLSDPLARGSYAHVTPGSGDPRGDLALPVAERLFFAGDTVGGDLAMTVGGAWRSGETAAKAIARVLA
jgi:monoamine oxidase